ncbi:syntaxin-2-like [Thalassophryne amazonica]|uniref:syntaxin-2-like n=1 Tax=Thalassophryne amazonica TaxID=390379 RepID=UPI001472418D|nr:syntaxin-2-like [Thalassophryne amazonica]XP_034048546.1 syntaxin-2-like [Thalassophryne amazonica]
MGDLSDKNRIEDLFKKVQEVKSLVERMSCITEDMEKIHTVILSTPNQEKRNNELETLDSEAKKTANVIRDKLEDMQKSFPADEDSSSVSVIHRIQKNQHSHLTRWFGEVMKCYHNSQISFREKCKAQIQKQLEIVNQKPTDEELEEMLHCDNPAIFTSDICPNSRITEAALSQIESRHQDIIRLESTIKELHELFVDMAMVLELQGELMNNIEKNVSSAAEFVDESKDETEKAILYKKQRYRIATLPKFFKPLRRRSSAKEASDRNHSDFYHD